MAMPGQGSLQPVDGDAGGYNDDGKGYNSDGYGQQVVVDEVDANFVAYIETAEFQCISVSWTVGGGEIWHTHCDVPDVNQAEKTQVVQVNGDDQHGHVPVAAKCGAFYLIITWLRGDLFTLIIFK